MTLDRARRFDDPVRALNRPREALVWLLPLLRRLGFPDPDPHWQRTAQVNWSAPTTFGQRFACLYLGHDLREKKVRERIPYPEPGWVGDTGLSYRLDCSRCGWEGPWTR